MKTKLVRITTVPISLYKLLSGQLKFMNNYFEVTAISSPGWELEKVANNEGIETISVSIARKPSILKDMISLFKLRNELKKISPQIVHTHTPKAGLLGMTAAFVNQVPIRLHTVAGLPWIEYKGIKKFIFICIEYITYKFATHVYCNSFHLMNYIIKKNIISKSKISVIGNGSSNGIDTNYFSPNVNLIDQSFDLKKKYTIDDEKVLIFIGRLVKEKGVEELVDAFVSLKVTHKKIKLILLGPLEPERDPLSINTKVIIDNNPDIIITGYKDDIRPYLCLSYLLVFPSYREGFPNVPMQAAAFNIPSIVTDINGCNEIILNYQNGLIVKPRSVKELKTAIELLLTDKVLYNRLKENCRKNIVERFDQLYFWNKILVEYNNHLNKII